MNEKNAINKSLLEKQRKWEEECYKPLKEVYENNEAKLGKISCAFSFGVSDHYVNANKKVMIIGQEANGHTFDYKKWGLNSWQTWAISYLERQVYKEHTDDLGYNRSPFWRFFRKFEKSGYAPCWNNLDKVRRYICVDEKDWVESKLSYDEQNSDREKLNAKIFDGKSLLQKEIEIASPDIIVFIVGPNNPYYHALGLAFFDGDRVDSKLEEVYPKHSEKDCCQEFSKMLGLNVPTYWTYHPNFLSRNGLFNKVVGKIIGDKD